MRVNEIIKQMDEGVNDPHIFKAVFLAGGPGSGKSFVANKMLSGTGLRTINSDDIYEYMMRKAGKQLTPDRKSTSLNSSHMEGSRMPSCAWKKKDERSRE